MTRLFMYLLHTRRPRFSRAKTWPVLARVLGGPFDGEAFRLGNYIGEVMYLPSDPACRQYSHRQSKYRFDGAWVFLGVVVVNECAGAGTRGGKA